MIRHLRSHGWQLLQFLFTIGVAVLLVIGARELLDARQQLARLEITIPDAALIAAATLGTYLTMAHSVNVLVTAIGGRSRPWRVFQIITASIAAGLLTPFRLGIPLRLFLYKRELGVSLTKATAVGTLEVTLSMFTAALLTTVAGLFAGDPPVWAPWLGTAVMVVLCGLGIVVVRRESRPGSDYDGIERSGDEDRRGRGMRAWFERYRQGLLAVPLGAIGRCLILFVLRNLFAAARLWIVCRLADPAARLQPVDVLLSHSLAVLVMPLSLLPAGLGTFDLSLTLLLCRQGMSTAAAVLALLIQRVLSSGLFLVLGLISIWRLRASTR